MILFYFIFQFFLKIYCSQLTVDHYYSRLTVDHYCSQLTVDRYCSQLTVGHNTKIVLQHISSSPLLSCNTISFPLLSCNTISTTLLQNNFTLPATISQYNFPTNMHSLAIQYSSCNTNQANYTLFLQYKPSQLVAPCHNTIFLL